MAHGRRSAAGRVILGVETSCDDTCAAVVDPGGAIRSNVVASQGLLHARYGGVVPEVASRHHLELLDAVIDDALERAGLTLDDIDQRSGHARARPDRRAARRRVDGQGDRRRARAAARPRRPPARARGGQHAGRRPDRAAVPVPGRERRPHVPGPRRRAVLLHRARPHARRRRGRGVRQGRAAAGPGLPGRPGARPRWPSRATRRPSTSRARSPATGSTSRSAA